MNLDSDDLLARINHDWPAEYEMSRLRLLVERQADEIDRLSTLMPAQTVTGSYSAPNVRPYIGADALTDVDGAPPWRMTSTPASVPEGSGSHDH